MIFRIGNIRLNLNQDVLVLVTLIKDAIGLAVKWLEAPQCSITCSTFVATEKTTIIGKTMGILDGGIRR